MLFDKEDILYIFDEVLNGTEFGEFRILFIEFEDNEFFPKV